MELYPAPPDHLKIERAKTAGGEQAGLIAIKWAEVGVTPRAWGSLGWLCTVSLAHQRSPTRPEATYASQLHRPMARRPSRMYRRHLVKVVGGLGNSFASGQRLGVYILPAQIGELSQ